MLFVHDNVGRNNRRQGQTRSEQNQSRFSPLPNGVGEQRADDKEVHIARQVPRRNDTLYVRQRTKCIFLVNFVVHTQ